MTKTIGKVSVLMLMLVFLAAPVFGQGESSLGRITGRVSDPSGAVVAGATVEILNVGTGVRTRMDSNSEGLYAFLLVPIGDYTVTATKPGFKRFEQAGVRVISGQRATLDITLTVG